MLNKEKKSLWDEVKGPLAFIGSIVVATFVISSLARASGITGDYPADPSDGSPEEMPEIDWSVHEPEKLADIQIIKDGEVVFDNFENNINITNALRLSNAVMAGDRDAEWAMPIIQDWLAKVE